MTPIYINFKPSKILNTLLILAAFGSICMLILVEFSYVIKTLLAVFIALCTAYNVVNKALLLMPWSFVALNVNIKNEWQLHCKDGRKVKILVSKSSVVTEYLTILNFKIQATIANDESAKKGAKTTKPNYLLSHSIVIFPDSIDAENYRRLRVFIRWGTLREIDLTRFNEKF